MEEAGEVVQAASKVLRFGDDDKGSDGTKPTTLERLQAEYNDVIALAGLINEDYGAMVLKADSKLIAAKQAKMREKMAKSREQGRLQ